MNIIEAKKNHLNEIFELMKQSNDYHNDICSDVFSKPDFEAQKKWLSGFIGNDKAIFLLAVIEEKVVGFIVGEKMDREPHRNVIEHLSISELAVDENYRRQNIATDLFNKIKKEARNRFRLSEVELTVYGRNKPAIEFYKSLGMELLYSNFIGKI